MAEEKNNEKELNEIKDVFRSPALRSMIKDEVRKVKEDKDLVYQKNFSEENYSNDLDSNPDASKENKENQRKEFEESVKNLKLDPIITEEIRRVQEEKDFYQKKEYISELETLPDANEPEDLERISGKLGFTQHNDEDE